MYHSKRTLMLTLSVFLNILLSVLSPISSELPIQKLLMCRGRGLSKTGACLSNARVRSGAVDVSSVICFQ